MGYRIEKDSMGEIHVSCEKLWGAQTQRSIKNFDIGKEKLPLEFIFALAIVKKAAVTVNGRLGIIPEDIVKAITTACNEILEGKWNDQFPLSLWQTGSGTQTNMNINEVIANRANQLLTNGNTHPNDHVNRGQSSNDVFPTAMHITCVLILEKNLIPALERLASSFEELSNRYSRIVKVGRTHLQDATPITLGQEISAWHAMLKSSREMVMDSLKYLRPLALGGTAVGTGLNTHRQFGELCAKEISNISGSNFTSSENMFHALSSRDALVFAHGALNTLAGNLMKIANDVRWLASGPRCGIGEIKIPENEPGSSIMPGKVNPTQSEALTMVCVRVMGNDTSVGIASSQGNFQLNVYLPLIIHSFVQSATLLSHAMDSFNNGCVKGIVPNHERIENNLRNSLMLVTALTPHIGYDKAAEIAKTAHDKGITLKMASELLGVLTPQEFDKLMDPSKMVAPLE
ncbi:class II fumarate hydratase [Alkalicella caledoniensis]|uniref:Fumarate hydratase class II n=1 Tax=Alkalicella caledoniensis TaxID=2731377 RepID=A0A7G9W8U9_ALKCA|nr:class II fumarate hydratase [Alkalicella caledoniensis]QNO15111.1 class II fumarate hydratase [Alkalicella caledoniensis]